MQTRSILNDKVADVSVYQGLIDFEKVAASKMLDGMIARCRIGATGQDKYFTRNYAGAKSIGLRRGAYVFAYPATSSGPAEAENLVKTVEAAGGFDGFDPILDLERAGAGSLSVDQNTKWAHSFFNRLEQLGYKDAILYSSSYFLRTGIRASEFYDKKLWVADYIMYGPPDTAGWPSWYGWQYTDKGRIPGISGYVDLSEFQKSNAKSKGGTSVAVLKLGSKGPDVETLQKNLNTILHLSLNTDGVFGTKTEAAVKAFQAKYAPPVDGEVGPITEAAMKKQLAPQTPAENTSNVQDRIQQALAHIAEAEKILKG